VAPRRLIALALASTGVALLTAGCGRPPDLRPQPTRPPTPTTPSPSAARTLPATLPPTTTAAPSPTAPSPTGFPESSVVSCGGRPGGTEVLAVLRRAGLATSSTTAQVSTGPMCAGTWQWSVVQFPNADPLQVVTRGPAGSLTLVTAGTDVCSIPVRTEAPAGIRAAACDAQPPSL
jgi:hypothetical protein